MKNRISDFDASLRNEASFCAPLRRMVAATLAAFALMTATSGCVTVNVNFPESAVQKATDDYVRELYRAKEKGRGTAPASSSGATSPDSKPSSKPEKSSMLESLPSDFAFFIPEAQAAGADLNFHVDSDKALSIRDRLAARLEEVLAQKRAGIMGETNDGMLVLRQPEKLKKLLAKKIEKTVDEENRDRKELYLEVLEANKINSGRLKDIQRSFSRSFQAESPSGTWVQDSEGGWSQKP